VTDSWYNGTGAYFFARVVVINLSFLGATRLHILLLLRRAPRTIGELGEILRVSDNAVRSHVISLERDQLVRPGERRPGVRKPSATYVLTETADQMFAKPYAQVLGAVIGEVRERHGRDEVVDVLRTIGARMARGRIGPVAELRGRGRIEAIARLIDDLGGLAEIEERDGRFVVRGYNCPLLAIVGDHPEICQLIAALIEGILGNGTVRECCQRGEEVACCFEIDLTTPRPDPIPTDVIRPEPPRPPRMNDRTAS
jgi:predicted ArsR family transcriptional regulator